MVVMPFAVISQQSDTSYQKTDLLPKSYYLVTKIKKKGSVFIIYTRNNDICYKIVSIKSNSDRCNKLKKGRSYALTLKPYYSVEDLSCSIVDYVIVNGVKILLTDCHANIYSSLELNGLNYLPGSKDP